MKLYGSHIVTFPTDSLYCFCFILTSCHSVSPPSYMPSIKPDGSVNSVPQSDSNGLVAQ
jgi:hypothetical protein